MKKNLVLVLTAVMLTMTACGAKDDAQTTDVQVSTEAEAQVSSEAKESTEASKEEEKENIADGVIGNLLGINEYYPGVYTETGYESEFVGYRFTTPENVVLLTQEEREEAMGMTFDEMKNDDPMAKYAEMATIMDLCAQMETGTNVNLTLSMISGDDFTLDEFVTEIKKGLPAQGLTATEGYETVTFAGKEAAKFGGSMSMQGVMIYQEYYLFLDSDFCGMTTFTWIEGSEDEKQALVDAFAAY